jgi:filamentous hemagglutinin family protein
VFEIVVFNLTGQPMSDMTLSRRLGPPLIVACLVAGPVQAQIVTDGTVGPKVSLSGGEIKIGADLGSRRGDNLFHSFEKFGIGTGQTATFTGPGEIKNVISRVTGGEVSNIDGTLASKVGQADFYFLNPAGVMFGPNATLDVPGSFHVSTAHELRFADGASFSALDKTGSGLTVAPAEAFGFLDKPPNQITVDQSQLKLQPGKTLSLVGGDIDLAGGTIAVAGGSPVGSLNAGAVFNAVSVASSGEARVSGGTVDAPRLGSIRIANQRITTSGNGGGLVRIRAGALTVANSALNADNTGDWPEIGVIDLMAGDLALTDSRISTEAQSVGRGGIVAISADTMTVRNSGPARVPDRRGIHSDTQSQGNAGMVIIRAGSMMLSGSGAVIKSDALAGTGKAGTVAIDAGTLELHSGGYIGSDTFSSGPAGVVTVQADRMLIDGAGLGFTGLTSSTLREATGREATGDGGSIDVTASNLELRDGGTLNTSTFNRGNAGKVTVNVTGNLVVSGFNKLLSGGIAESRISSRSQGLSTGEGGTVQITAGTLDVRDGGVIDSDSNGTGPAGSVIVKADRVTVSNASSLERLFTRISSRGNMNSQGSGSVKVKAHVLELHDGGTISTTSLGTGQAGQITVTADKLLISGIGAVPENRSGIYSTAWPSSQAAGTISINAGEMEVRDGGGINTESLGNAPGGPIIIKVTDTLRLDNATIQAKTASTTGGNVSLTVDQLSYLNNSIVTTSVASGEGSGGNIQIKLPLMVLGNSEITANAIGGSGGDIFIDAGQLIRTPDSKIMASGSVNGDITITAPNTDISSSLAILPETFLDASSQLRETCAARGGRPTSSFAPGGRGGLPPDPGAPLAASPFGQPPRQQTATGAPTTLTAKPRQAINPITIAGIPQPVLGSPGLKCRG